MTFRNLPSNPVIHASFVVFDFLYRFTITMRLQFDITKSPQMGRKPSVGTIEITRVCGQLDVTAIFTSFQQQVKNTLVERPASMVPSGSIRPPVV